MLRQPRHRNLDMLSGPDVAMATIGTLQLMPCVYLERQPWHRYKEQKTSGREDTILATNIEAKHPKKEESISHNGQRLCPHYSYWRSRDLLIPCSIVLDHREIHLFQERQSSKETRSGYGNGGINAMNVTGLSNATSGGLYPRRAGQTHEQGWWVEGYFATESRWTNWINGESGLNLGNSRQMANIIAMFFRY